MKNTLINGFTSSIVKEHYGLVFVDKNTKEVKVSGMGIDNNVKGKKEDLVKRHKSHYQRR